MDIHELRQFESVYKPSKEVAFCWLRKQYVQLSTEENHTEIVDHANDSLRIWQAAKAQADQKVKLLLCDEHLKKCESPTGIFNSQYPDEEPCLICLAKEAKAQAVPEKDAIIKKLSDQLYSQEMKTSAARTLCETACELLDDYAHQDAMVILNDLEQAMIEAQEQKG